MKILAEIICPALTYTIQYKPTELILKGQDGSVSRLTVSLKYLPVKMHLDASESINNMGTLRVDVLDAADLPAADRNGFSDPYCKFNLNDKEIYKTKIQKKTLHPAWNEFFECPVKSRTAAKFKLSVMDWDFGDKADFLGGADINLELLEPFKPKEITLNLDGKSGVVRLKMLFKPDYVTRSRQGSSTFSGTFATPGKIVGAPVKGVGKGVGLVGGGVVKGASFLRHGFKSKKDGKEDTNGFIDPPEEETIVNGETTETTTPQKPPQIVEDRSSPSAPATPVQNHKRNSSFGGTSMTSGVAGNTPNKTTDAPSGTAMFMIQAAEGYPASSKLQIHVKQSPAPGGKGSGKEVHKTKAIKTGVDNKVEFTQEMFRVTCSPDTQFQIQVKDDKLLGGHDLGEAIFFINDSAQGMEKSVKVGDGSVLLTTTFLPNDNDEGAGFGKAGSVKDSPRAGSRRSFLSKRNRDVSSASNASNAGAVTPS